MKVQFGLMMILLGGTSLSAQQISFDFGARAGVPITQPVPPLTHYNMTRTTIGGPRLAAAPTFTLFMDNRFGVDVEALFRPIRYKTESEDTCCSSSDSTRATALEVPVIGSYHFGNHTIRPYAGAGLIIYERQWGRVDTRTILHNQGNIRPTLCSHMPTRHRMHRHHLSSQAESTTRKIDGLFARNSATRTGEGKVCGGRINGIFSLELHFAHFGSEATELYPIEFVDACPGDVCPRVGWDSQRSFEGFAEYEMMTR